MVSINRLTDRLSVAPQPREEDFATIAAAGFKTVINNRPDGEEQGQLDHERACERAARAGLDYRYLPVKSGEITDADVTDFQRLLDDCEEPVLAHCRSGARSATLWALSQRDRSPQEVLRIAQEAGYDLSGLKARFEARRPQSKGDGDEAGTAPVPAQEKEAARRYNKELRKELEGVSGMR